jgi:invasion protein IalB
MIVFKMRIFIKRLVALAKPLVLFPLVLPISTVTSPAQSQPADPVPSQAAQPSPAPSIPAVAAGEAMPASPVKSQKFDDWYYRCADVGSSTNCEVAQVAQVAKDGKNVSVLTLAIARSPGVVGKDGKKSKRSWTLTTLVPLNIFLPSGLTIKADGKFLTRLAYRNCNQAGCWSQQVMDAPSTDGLAKSAVGEGLLKLMNGQDISIRFSLKGLKAALAELQGTGGK